MFQHTVLIAVTGNGLTGLSTAFPSSNTANTVTNLGGGRWTGLDWTGLVYVTLECDVQNWFRLQCKAEAMFERRQECNNQGRAYAEPP
jgi:hypothetical protein